MASRVYQASSAHSNYKSIKVECTLEGSYEKLISILSDVSRHKEWVYNNKSASILKKLGPYEFYYYTETTLPWPMSNRDAIIHLKMEKDSAGRFLRINASAVPEYMDEKSGKVRIRQSSISWYVTRPSSRTIQIVYIFDANPGGSVPAWLANNFADKGPYESFKKLSEMLKK